MTQGIGRHVWLVLLVAAMVGTATGISAQAPAPVGVPGQPGLTAASPRPNALLAVAPPHIELEFAAPIDPQTVSVRLIGPTGADVALGPVQVVQPEALRILAPPPGRLAGDYIVMWSARAVEDDTLFAGAYPFRSGDAATPGAAGIDSEWPRPWAVVLRWGVFLGTAMAAGGFAWSLLPAAGSSAQTTLPLGRTLAMTSGAVIALLSTAVLLVPRLMIQGASWGALARSLPPGWWVRLVALVALTLLCLAVLLIQRRVARLPPALPWFGLGAGLAVLLGLSLTSRATAVAEPGVLAVEIAHQWSTALWISGLIYLIGAWRGFGTDVARFRAVRWVGGVLVAISIVTGIARALPIISSVPEALVARYGQVLAAKSLLVVAIVALGLLALVVPRGSNALLASGSLAVQGALALATALLAAMLALMALPGTVVRASLAGVDLVEIVSLDASVFGHERGMVHLLARPDGPGPRPVVVRLTDLNGTPLAAAPAPAVTVAWTRMAGDDPAQVRTSLQQDGSGALFVGAVTLPEEGWWQAVVEIAPPAGVATHARGWLLLPDPNLAGHGPNMPSDPTARDHFEQGLMALTSLRAVRMNVVANDGRGEVVSTRSAVREANAEHPAALQIANIDASGAVISETRNIDGRVWSRSAEGEWSEEAPAPLLTPARWGQFYQGATSLQLGPRQSIEGELSQIVTFWTPGGRDGPAWYAWWIGLASGEVRRQVEIAPGRYVVTDFSDFDALIEIAPPRNPATERVRPSGTPTVLASPVATPGRTMEP